MYFISILPCVLGSVSTDICGEGTLLSDKQALVHTLYPLGWYRNWSSLRNFCILLRTRETFWRSPNHQILRWEGTPAPLSCIYFSSVNHLCVGITRMFLASLGSLRGWAPKICFLTLLHLFRNGDHLEKMTWGSPSETVQPQSLLPSSQALLLLPQPEFWKTILG